MQPGTVEHAPLYSHMHRFYDCDNNRLFGDILHNISRNDVVHCWDVAEEKVLDLLYISVTRYLCGI